MIRRIRLLLAAMTVLLALSAAPALADHNCIGVVQNGECLGVGDAGDHWDHWEAWLDRDHLDWDDEWGWAEIDLDDCFWWDGDLFCEVDF